jgi:hypothetical protein
MRLWVKIVKIQIEDDIVYEYFDSIFGICFNLQFAHKILAIKLDLRLMHANSSKIYEINIMHLLLLQVLFHLNFIKEIVKLTIVKDDEFFSNRLCQVMM